MFRRGFWIKTLILCILFVLAGQARLHLLRAWELRRDPPPIRHVLSPEASRRSTLDSVGEMQRRRAQQFAESQKE